MGCTLAYPFFPSWRIFRKTTLLICWNRASHCTSIYEYTSIHIYQSSRSLTFSWVSTKTGKFSAVIEFLSGLTWTVPSLKNALAGGGLWGGEKGISSSLKKQPIRPHPNQTPINLTGIEKEETLDSFAISLTWETVSFISLYIHVLMISKRVLIASIKMINSIYM